MTLRKVPFRKFEVGRPIGKCTVRKSYRVPLQDMNTVHGHQAVGPLCVDSESVEVQKRFGTASGGWGACWDFALMMTSSVSRTRSMM